MKTKNTQSGFTLLELIVVIAIIGILTAIIVVSLVDSRNKGKDGNLFSTLSNARAQASLYFTNNASTGYEDVCTTSQNVEPRGVLEFVTSANTLSDGVTCDSSETAWAMEAHLNAEDKYFCVDSNGSAKKTDTSSGITDVDPECDGTI